MKEKSIANPVLRDAPDASALEAWHGMLVRERLREAFEIERRMPAVRGSGAPSSAWLFAVRHEFSDMVGWDDARARVWESWSRARGAYPYEVSRMDEAFGWLSLLRDHDAERRCLAAWALLTAKGASVRLFLQRRRWSRTTFYRRVVDGSDRIALVLTQRGVQQR